MRPLLKSIRINGDFRISCHYEDGLVAELDFKSHLESLRGPIVEPLTEESFFSQALIDHGILTWPNGFDVCPDVLRFWCEQGQICNQAETNAHFAKPTTVSSR